MGTRQTVGLFWFAYERTRVGHTALFLQPDIGRASGRLLVGCVLQDNSGPAIVGVTVILSTSPARLLIRREQGE